MSASNSVRKRINDPLHGAIFLSELEFKLASTPAFLRLGNVKQLGLGGFVYPGALYSRHSHSLGACHVLGQMLDAIEANGHQVPLLDRRELRIAALLHDLGHFPFSHTTEQVTSTLKSPPLFDDGDGAERREYFDDHEDVGHYLIQNDPVISKLLTENGIDPRNIVERLKGGVSNLSFLVSSDLDCDRLDYLRRTALMAGLPFGGVDAEYLIDNMTLDVDGMPCLRAKARGSADHFLVSRMYDYEELPFHKAVVGFEEALKKVLEAMVKGGFLRLDREFIAGEVANNTWRRFDDQTLMGAIRNYYDSIPTGEDRIKPYVDCILNRRAPKLVFGYELLDSMDPTSGEAFQKIVENMTTVFDEVMQAEGVPPHLTFRWTENFPILKDKQAGRVRLLHDHSLSRRSVSIEKEAGTLCARLDGLGRRYVRFYACLSDYQDPKETRAMLRARVVQRLREEELPGPSKSDFEA